MATCYMAPTKQQFGKGKMMGTVKCSMLARGSQEKRKNDQVECRAFLRKLNYSVRYCNGRYKS